MKLFSTFFKKPLDNEIKINYNKENETGNKKHTHCYCVSPRLNLVVYGCLTLNIIPLNSTKVKRKGVFCLEKVYSCEDIANRYGVKVETIWAWIREKRLSAVKIGKSYRVKEADLLAFEKANRTTEQ